MIEKIVYLGPLYQQEREGEILENSIYKSSNAPNVFQWSLIHGIQHHIKKGLKIINVLPVGVWPKQYKQAILPERTWDNNGTECIEIGGLNFPFFKQMVRAARIKKELRGQISVSSEVLIYSAYMPFLKAVFKLSKEVKVTLIVTDLPEFYDLGKTSVLKKWLRIKQNKMIYRYLERVDRFILLTEQMKEPLHVGDRPWMLMEGICEAQPVKACATEQERAILYTGTLHYQYGIENLLDAFEGIEDATIQLWICGSGEAETEITELAKRDSRVKFFGFCGQNTIATLRERAAILVNPRTNEGEYTKYSFPSKTMEYMASGKPVVMYKLDGIPHEYDQYLFYPEENTAQSFREKLKYVLNHPNEANKIGRAAQRFVAEKKSSKAQARRVLNFIMNPSSKNLARKCE